MLIPRKKSIADGTMIKETGIFLLLIFSFGCFFNNETTQYIVMKDGKKLQPYAKVIYQVSADRQEVAYRIETPGKERSQLYKLKKCRVADPNNWEGEADYILLWKIRVEMVNGKISSPGEGLVNVDWYKWHFKTDPSPGPLSTILRYGFLFLVTLATVAVILIIVNQWVTKRRERVAIGDSRNDQNKK